MLPSDSHRLWGSDTPPPPAAQTPLILPPGALVLISGVWERGPHLCFTSSLLLGLRIQGSYNHTIISQDNLGKKGARGACPTRNQYLAELHMDSGSVTLLRDRGGSGNRAHGVEI